MIDASFVVDWVNVTCHDTKGRRPYEIACFDTTGVWAPSTPVHGYTRAFSNDCGARTMWHHTRNDMGYHVQYSGRTLNAYAIVGITAFDILAHHSAHKDTVKRIDLAIDVRDTDLNIPDLYRQLKDGQAKTFVKTFNLIQGTTGDTLYCGSRQSDMFLRVYDKGRQLGTIDNWKRIELEVKGTRAMMVARAFASETMQGMFAMAQKMIAGMVMFDDDTWKSVVGDLALRLGKAQDNESDTAGWILGQVAPAMAKYMNETGDFDILDKFLMIVHSLTGEK